MDPAREQLAASSRREFDRWPDWRCIAIVPSSGRVCDGRATYYRPSIDPSASSWTYCAGCRTSDCIPIPPDFPYYVTRLELRVALTGAPACRAAATAEAVRRALGALEAVGARVVDARVVGRVASAAAASGEPLRLQLAGKGEPAPRSESLVRAPTRPAWMRPVEKRRAG